MAKQPGRNGRTSSPGSKEGLDWSGYSDEIRDNAGKVNYGNGKKLGAPQKGTRMPPKMED